MKVYLHQQEDNRHCLTRLRCRWKGGKKIPVKNTLVAYLPQDRLFALGRGETLPDRTTGAALFADISGFTALTENLQNTLGARRGAEELTKYLERVYTALIAEVEKFGGSVIDFAGDAITCWFEEKSESGEPCQGDSKGKLSKDAGQSSFHAAACALAMQAAMEPFAEIVLTTGAATALALKVSVASGPARRFVVGDPAFIKIDTLAGTTLDRMALGERLANRGEVVLDANTAERLGSAAQIAEWRAAPDVSERFAVLYRLDTKRSLPPSVRLPDLSAETLRPWIHPRIYERETSGQGALMAEFRPCIAMFVRFLGIDYDAEAAEAQLDAFVRQVQTVVARRDGTLLQIIIGDKGSYAYISFGALTAHEDDAFRAVKSALELRDLAGELGFLQPLQIGLSLGVQYVGTCGGSTRRSFGVLGDEVNLAARLMQAAGPGEILLSGRVKSVVEQSIAFEPRLPLAVKGKSQAVPVYVLNGLLPRSALRLLEPVYANPMVGRQAEMQSIAEKLDLVMQGRSQVIGIVAAAGVGKSRLVTEVIRLAQEKGFVGYGGACQSEGINSSYLAWKPVWEAFFGVDPTMPSPELIRSLEYEIKSRVPRRLKALPLLNQVLELPAPIPDNAFTAALDPETRRSVLYALLEDSLKAAARTRPILIVLENIHWLDALSHDLLETLARALAAFPVCFVLAYRPPQLDRIATQRLELLPQFTQIVLTELSSAESEMVVRYKLAQLYPVDGDHIAPLLVRKIVARAQGNPFYLEELLNYLHDQGLNPDDPAALNQLELPERLHTLILSRIDQLGERKKVTLQVASIIGRIFRAAWLPGYYPALGSLAQVKAELDELDSLDITSLSTTDPEMIYLFKHIITHEVTYESLPFTTRERLHEQLALFLEATYAADAWLDALAYHYGQSRNIAKKIEYLQKAGDAAQAVFANEAALDYFERLYPLLAATDDPVSEIDLHLKWGAVLERAGRWVEADKHYQEALARAEASPKLPAEYAARCRFALGELCGQRGDFSSALTWLTHALEDWNALGERSRASQTLVEMGWIHYSQGDNTTARKLMQEGLAITRELDDKVGMAQALNDLGTVAWTQGDYAEARHLFEESLALDRDEKRGVSVSLNNLGLVAHDQRDYPAARRLYEESLALAQEMGNKANIATSFNNLGALADDLGEYEQARTLYEESLALKREMGDRQGVAMALNNLGGIARSLGDYVTAQSLHEESLAIRRDLGDKGGIANTLHSLGLVALAQRETASARQLMADSLRLRVEREEKQGIVSCLIGLGAAASQENRAVHTARLAGAVESLLAAMKLQIDPDVTSVHQAALSFAQNALSKADFDRAFGEGRLMSLEQAIALALRDDAGA